jgi:hypothetical protein
MTMTDEGLLPLPGQLTAPAGPDLIDDVAAAWQKIIRKFTPLIGASSVLLILERSLDQHRTAFGWLPAGALPTRPDAAVERLRASMARRPHADILAAHPAILATFSKLMTTLIGAGLTVQFLRAAFPVDAVKSTSEENRR